MVPSVQHLHGKPVALSNSSDQDLVRRRLCRAQWPSRKVGRIGLAGGSTGKARFLKLSQASIGICDVPHKRPLLGSLRRRPAERNAKNGIIIQKGFPSVPTIRCRPYQGLVRKTAFACATGRGRPCRASLSRLYWRIRLITLQKPLQNVSRGGFGRTRIGPIKIPNLKAFLPNVSPQAIHDGGT
jgi:hypothetical protein